MEEKEKEEYLVIEYNKKAFLLPIVLIVVGAILIFYSPNLRLSVLGGLIALAGVLSLMVLSLALSQLKMFEGIVSREEEWKKEEKESE